MDSRHEMTQARVADLTNDTFFVVQDMVTSARGILRDFDIFKAELESQGIKGASLGGNPHRNKLKGAEAKAIWLRSVVDTCNGWFLTTFVTSLCRRPSTSCRTWTYHRCECKQMHVRHTDCLRTGPSVHVTLPCSLAGAEQLCLQLSELAWDAYAYGGRSESLVKEMLRYL